LWKTGDAYKPENARLCFVYFSVHNVNPNGAADYKGKSVAVFWLEYGFILRFAVLMRKINGKFTGLPASLFKIFYKSKL
jgi:hypothetical protein